MLCDPCSQPWEYCSYWTIPYLTIYCVVDGHVTSLTFMQETGLKVFLLPNVNHSVFAISMIVPHLKHTTLAKNVGIKGNPGFCSRPILSSNIFVPSDRVGDPSFRWISGGTPSMEDPHKQNKADKSFDRFSCSPHTVLPLRQIRVCHLFHCCCIT